MEGIAGEHAPLDEAVARYPLEALAKLEKTLVRPSFLRAQVGFNNNVKYKGQTFHIQTEDSGLDNPHVITHLFADGGRVIKSHKRSYAAEVSRDDVAAFVRQLMKGQQLEMALGLREGRFDAIIDGKTLGGMELLDYPPKADVQKLATQKKERVAAAGADRVSHPEVAPVASAEGRARLLPHQRAAEPRGGPESYEPRGTEAILGSQGAIALPGERFCHPREAAIRYRNGRVWLNDFESGNGVFLRIRAPIETGPGDEFIVGDQLLRIERNPVPFKTAPTSAPRTSTRPPSGRPRSVWSRSSRAAASAPACSRGARRCRSAAPWATSCFRATRS